MKVEAGSTSEDGSSSVVSIRRFSSKVYVDSPMDSTEGSSSSSPRKNDSEELPVVHKKSFVSPHELEVDPELFLSQKKPSSIVTRWSSSDSPVSAEDDLSFRVTGRKNGSVIYLPQAHVRSLEQLSLSSRSVPAVAVTHPVIARRRSDHEKDAQLENDTLHRKSTSNLPLPPLPKRGSIRRSIAETQDSFRENMRRRKSSKYQSAYSPREGSHVGQDHNASGSAGAGGARHTDCVRNAVQNALTKTSKTCCIL